MIIYFDENKESSLFSFYLDLDRKKVVYSDECKKFLKDIEIVLASGKRRLSKPHEKDRNRCVLTPINNESEDKKVFLGMLVNTLGLEGCGNFKDMVAFNVPENLRFVDYKRSISFDGVVKYFRMKDITYLPDCIVNDKDVLKYFKFSNCV